MVHYAGNLHQAMGKIARSYLARPVSQGFSSPGAGLSSVFPIVQSESAWRHRLFEKYSPRYYHEIVKNLVSACSPDVAHIVSPSTGLLSLVTAFRSHGVRTVYTLHDPTPHDERKTVWGRSYEAYQRRYQLPHALSVVDALHVHSGRHLIEVRRRFGEAVSAKVYVVQHGAGVPADVLTGTERPLELGLLRSDRPTVLFFGRIEPYKGLKYLVEAVRCLDADGCSVNLVVAGAGSLDCDMIQAGGSNLIVINRFIRDDEVRSLFEEADLVVLPYVNATQSGVVPLAYAFGKPVIATDVGAIGDIVADGETGCLVPPCDSQRLAEAIGSLIRDRDRLKDMGANASRCAALHLNWQSIGREHLACYMRVVGKLEHSALNDCSIKAQ